MPTTRAVLGQHPKAFGENDLEAMLSIEEENMPAPALADIEDVLGDEWDFGVSAMTIDAIRILIAGE